MFTIGSSSGFSEYVEERSIETWDNAPWPGDKTRIIGWSHRAKNVFDWLAALNTPTASHRPRKGGALKLADTEKDTTSHLILTWPSQERLFIETWLQERPAGKFPSTRDIYRRHLRPLRLRQAWSHIETLPIEEEERLVALRLELFLSRAHIHSLVIYLQVMRGLSVTIKR